MASYVFDLYYCISMTGILRLLEYGEVSFTLHLFFYPS